MNDQDYIRTRPAADTHKQYRRRTMASVFVVALLFRGSSDLVRIGISL